MKDTQERNLGGYVKRQRERNGWGTRELARRAGLDPTVIVRLESGNTRHSRLDTLTALASAFKVPLVTMLAEAGQIEPCRVPCISEHLHLCYDHLPEKAVREIAAWVERADEEDERKRVPTHTSK